MARHGRRTRLTEERWNTVSRQLADLAERERLVGELSRVDSIPAELLAAAQAAPGLVSDEKRALQKARFELRRQRPRDSHFRSAVTEAEEAKDRQVELLEQVHEYLKRQRG